MLRDLLADTLEDLTVSSSPIYDCPECRDTGYVTTVVDFRRYTNPCDCQAHRRSRIPRPPWQLHTLADFASLPGLASTQAVINAASFARTGSGALIVTGPQANRLAVAIGNAMSDAGRPNPCFFRAQTLANDLEINFRSNYPRYTAYPALVIVRAPSYEAMREREAANFLELVDYRTDSGRVTIVATDFNHYPIPHAGHIDTGAIQQVGAIPSDLAEHMTFPAFVETSRAIRQVLCNITEWAAQPNGWLYISGGPGTGKTHLTVAVAQQRARAGDTVHFQTATALIDNLRLATSQSHQMYQHALHNLIETDLLAIDDLGTARDTPFAQEQLYKLLNARYETRRTTVVNSNMTPQRLAQDAPLIGSRMRDQALVTHVHVNAPDYRVHGNNPPDPADAEP